MAIQFIVEDGTGKNDATSYITVNELEQYFSNFGFDITIFDGTTPEITTANKQVILNRCTYYLDLTYNFSGIKTNVSQALSWPRQNCTISDNGWSQTIDNNIIPNDIKKAIALLVYYAGNNLISFDTQSDGKLIKREMNRIEGAVTTETEYFGPSETMYKITEIDKLLQKYIASVVKIQGINSLIRGCEE